jgi:hypothetical protein
MDRPTGFLPLSLKAADAAEAADYATVLRHCSRHQKSLNDAAIMRRWCAGDDYECPERAEWTDEDTGLRYCAEHAK